MTSVGIDAHTGQVIVGWAHVAQSIIKLVTTEIGSRLERRDLASYMPRLIDRPQNEEYILDFFMSIALALEPRQMKYSIYGEPRFDLIAIGINASTPGALVTSLTGDYLPDGHKDFGSPAVRKTLVIPIPLAQASS